MARKQISLSEKLAACLMQLVHPVEIDGKTVLRPIVDREAIKAIPDRKKAVAAVLAQFHCDHGVFVAIGGTTRFGQHLSPERFGCWR